MLRISNGETSSTDCRQSHPIRGSGRSRYAGTCSSLKKRRTRVCSSNERHNRHAGLTARYSRMIWNRSSPCWPGTSRLQCGGETLAKPQAMIPATSRFRRHAKNDDRRRIGSYSAMPCATRNNAHRPSVRPERARRCRPLIYWWTYPAAHSPAGICPPCPRSV